jgi:hypothetical protein
MSYAGWIKHGLWIWNARSSQVFEAAINRQNLPGDVGSCITEQKDCSIGNILNMALAARRESNPVRFSSLQGQAIHAFCRTDGSGGYHV